ncbi:D-glycero-beta-D-manno-heptose 1-phosphate adenylyltransferase [candidate division KSB1 bacterium]|nr:D-glycero-beta-D-manno-heptose 1-phosphate adenylyltransferase [candidate division KSB1 bacterium]
MVCLLSDLIEHVKSARAQNKKIVWTNGCFDIIHRGHVQYLKEASELGDVLIVGLNSDSSVHQLKGINRPVFSENDRAEVLSAIRYIDCVVIFDETSPAKIIQTIQPDIYVKGGDYDLQKLNQIERNIVEAYGGIIKFVSLTDNMSTTSIISKILQKG